MSTPSKLRALRSTTAALHPKRTLRHTSTTTTSPAATPTTEPLRSILIANRGEIALRVNRTASQTGIRTTTLYTDPDRLSQHALSSPFAINLGSTDQYLNGQRIIQLAKENGCEAIHPGYGFLSENAGFAKACEEGGHETASHCYRWIDYTLMDAEREERLIRQAIESFKQTSPTSRVPVGWYYGRPSPRSRALVSKVYRELGLELLYQADTCASHRQI